MQIWNFFHFNISKLLDTLSPFCTGIVSGFHISLFMITVKYILNISYLHSLGSKNKEIEQLIVHMDHSALTSPAHLNIQDHINFTNAG